MSKLTKALTAAAGNAGGGALYVEDVFSTYLYAGTGATHNIVNDIDLAGEGGMVWSKTRDTDVRHSLVDTERGAAAMLTPNETWANQTTTDSTLSFNSDGYTLGADAGNQRVNNSAYDYVGWSFRKAEKFFDVVTYTGDGVAGRTVAHNLGSVPGFVIIKDLGTTNWWVCYHHSLGNTKGLYLNESTAEQTNTFWNNTSPTSTEFTLGTITNVNASGNNYVAYLFASDAGGFGDDGTENIVSCGIYTGNGSTTGPVINLGFEPQWLMVKCSSDVSNWSMIDSMRGFNSIDGAANVALMYANLSNAEVQSQKIKPLATGFQPTDNGSAVNTNGATYIYIAIRRPMKTPESGTEVFAVDTSGSVGGGTLPAYRAPFPVDMALNRLNKNTVRDMYMASRLIQGWHLFTSSTGAEATEGNAQFDYNNGWYDTAAVDTNDMSWMFKRATGFMDVVAYTGTGGSSRAALTHNLGVVPELVIVKSRSNTAAWFVLSTSLGQFGFLNIGDGFSTTDLPYAFGDGSNYVAPTSTAFKIGSSINGNTQTFIAYLFATLAGVSKVGTYTGTAATQNIDCGFTAGARFILIKRANGATNTGDWYVWDSVRGISAGNDPYLLLNSTAAEVTNTDYIDPLSSGFTVTSTAPAALNASGGTYIFLAIA